MGERVLFVGLTKYGFYILGEMDEFVSKTIPERFSLSSIVKAAEVQNERGIGLATVPDLFFTMSDSNQVKLDDFIVYRVVSDKDDKAYQNYNRFLIGYRASQSGLVSAGGIASVESFNNQRRTLQE